jgi:hypothetical protein
MDTRQDQKSNSRIQAVHTVQFDCLSVDLARRGIQEVGLKLHSKVGVAAGWLGPCGAESVDRVGGDKRAHLRVPHRIRGHRWRGVNGGGFGWVRWGRVWRGIGFAGQRVWWRGML